MEPTNPWAPGTPSHAHHTKQSMQKQHPPSRQFRHHLGARAERKDAEPSRNDTIDTMIEHQVAPTIDKLPTLKTARIVAGQFFANVRPEPPFQQPPRRNTGGLEALETIEHPSIAVALHRPDWQPPQTHTGALGRGKATLLMALLCIMLIPALSLSSPQFLGERGWATVMAGAGGMGGPNLLRNIGQQNTNSTHHTSMTPQQYIDLIIKNMSTDQKLGQLMFVQCVCSDYSTSLDLSTMVAQNGVGAIILSPANNNIINANQLTTLTHQIQQNAQVPLLIATDQEGGTVDRLVDLDGPQPSAASIGLSGDPSQAQAVGARDAQDMSGYGLNLNLAPVVDVDNLYSSIMHQQGRTFGTDASTVTTMAGAYLRGLQQSGKVFGTLKHFPGLGDVNGDPHTRVTELNRTQSEMEQIDWAPYRDLIKQGLVHAIMVTHEILPAIDSSMPASLSPKVIQNILRDEMGFQGVIMTDSLTMDGVTAYATPGEAAALAIEAGSDLLMGAKSPNEVAAMIGGIKDALSSGALSQQRIDESVRRILTMKYQLGLLTIPKN